MAQACYGENIQAYDVLNQIGKGGFACVYKARCKRTGADVAIKIIDKQLMAAAGMVDRVRQEVRIHSRLQHPSILRLFTFFEDDAAVYLVLELCRNGELGQHVRTLGALNEDEARDYVRQIVEGMLHLHSNQILHRDLSLSNLLLDSNGHTKIADFGLATQLSSPGERHKTMCGTPNYISPEVATRSWHGMEADVWALGCMLYTMLVGRPPFDTDGVRSTLTRVVMADISIPSHVSAEAAGLMRGLLQKNPSERMALTAVLQHPFMARRRHAATTTRSWSAVDSGLGTIHTASTTACSADRPTSGRRLPRVRSLDRALTRRQPAHTDGPRSAGLPPAGVAQLRRRLEPLPTRPVVPGPQPADGCRSGSPTSGRSCCHGASTHRSCCERRHQDERCHQDEHRHQDERRHQDEHRHQNERRQQDECSCRSSEHGSNDVLHGIEPPSAAGGAVTSAVTSEGAAPPISPLSTRRLKVTRQKTKNAVVTLSDDGQVCLEFVRRRQGRDCVTDVCRISSDGMRVVIYRPDGGGTVPVTSEPPPMPRLGADAFYGYHSLPEKYWKKYIYAARFVKLVKAKTPKLTLYTELAKCVLMENGPAADFEAAFYDGSRVVKSADGVLLHEPNRKPYSLESVGGEQCLSETGRALWHHSQQCHEHCQKIEAALAQLESTDRRLGCFPLIVGRRPAPTGQVSSPSHDQENRSPTAAAPAQMRSFDGSILSTRTAVSAPVMGTAQGHVQVAGVGTATQRPDGRIHVACEDGSDLTVEPRSGAVQLRRADGRLEHFGKHDPLPSRVKRVMQQLPLIVQTLVAGQPRPRRGLRD